MTSNSDDDTFDITTTFRDAPVKRDEFKLAKEQKRQWKSEKEATDALRLEKAKENRERKRWEREKRRKRKRGEEVSSDEESDRDDDEDVERRVKKMKLEAGDSASSDSDDSDSNIDKKPKKRKTFKDMERKKQKKAEKKKREKALAVAGAEAGKDPYKRGEFGVWVGNLAFTTTPKAIKEFFNGGREILRVFCPPGDNGKMNRGFAYVDFATAEAQALAIKRSEHVLDKRNLLVKDSKNFTKTGRPKREDQETVPAAATKKPSVSVLKAPPQKHQPSSTLFVGNLSFNTTRESLQDLFEECGRIRKVRMATFEDSGKCKGVIIRHLIRHIFRIFWRSLPIQLFSLSPKNSFAYIDFYEPESATAALNARNKQHLMGRKLRMEYASAEATKRGAPWLLRKEQENVCIAADATQARLNLEKDEEKIERTPDDMEAVGRKIEKRNDDTRRSKRQDRRVQAHQKPGAVLANAPRQKVAAVKFEGKKITFD
ncbi:hypothetical protein BC936DRAFT_146308 [Jimgerdemannia flammicorona]|uniref:RRM domain-containing protein n=1 Tax=Jimgerdemannia flammicorona TaxID=994334 RepID=A0A433DLI2_9FUNG|nr:hypothetical protein BC936DRAFT_146308 [Jimgerdemannia flammicorona]